MYHYIEMLLQKVAIEASVIDVLETSYKEGWIDAKQASELSRKFGVVLFLN